ASHASHFHHPRPTRRRLWTSCLRTQHRGHSITCCTAAATPVSPPSAYPLTKVDDEGLTLHPRGVADIHLRAKREAQLEKLDAVPLDGPLLLLVIEPDLAVRVAHESDSVRVVAVDVGSHMFWVPVLHGLIADIER